MDKGLWLELREYTQGWVDVTVNQAMREWLELQRVEDGDTGNS